MTRQEFGRRFKAALAYADIRNYELAYKLGVTKMQISYYCTGQNVPRTARLKRISEITGVPFDFFTGVTNNIQ